MIREDFEKIRQVDGDGIIDVIVLWRGRDDDADFGYSVPVLTDDPEAEVYGGYATEAAALTAGIEHLAEIEGCTADEYRARAGL